MIIFYLTVVPAIIAVMALDSPSSGLRIDRQRIIYFKPTSQTSAYATPERIMKCIVLI